MLKQILALTAMLLPMCLWAKDVKPEIPVDQWMLSHSASAPKEQDGTAMHYPTINGGMATISTRMPVKIADKSQMLTNALMANGDNEEIKIASVEPEEATFAYSVTQQRGSYKDAATISYTLSGVCEKGQMTLTAHDISINYKEKGIIPRTLKIEKFNPSKNRRHEELIDVTSFEISKLMAEIAAKTETQKSEKVTHWQEILDGKVVKGMNMTEVTLAKGKPFSTSGPASKTKWRYEDNSVVIFTNGTVTRII